MAHSLEKSFEKNKPTKPKKKLVIPKAILGAVIGGGIGFLIAVAIGFFIRDLFITQEHQKRILEMTKQQAKNHSEYLQSYLKKISTQLDAQVNKPSLSTALELEDKNVITRLEQQIKKQIDDLVAVKIIPKASAKRDDSVFPPIGFAQLEMIKNTLKRQIVRPEAVKLDKDWYLHVTAPIPYDEQKPTLGVLMVTIPADALKNQFEEIDKGLGKVTLIQDFDEKGRGKTLFSMGRGNISDPKSSRVLNTYLKVMFTPSKKLENQTQVNSLFANLSILAVMALFVYLGMRVGRFIVQLRDKDGMDSSDAEHVSSGEKAAVPNLNQDILDIEIADEDEELLGLGDDVSGQAISNKSSNKNATPIHDRDVPVDVFRAYDIRGLYKTEITAQLAQLIGQALGSEALDAEQDTLIVGRDARTHSPELAEWLVRGILSTGCNVLNIGTVPTPLVYFATETLQESQSGVMVTASHNAAQYNGFKIVMNGKTRSEEDIQSIRRRILERQFFEGAGQEHRHDILNDYVDTIFSDVALAGDISVVIDAGNGVTGKVAPKLFEELGCNVTPLYCDLDGSFPNHPPDTSVAANLQDLIDKVQEEDADLGVAFDGDGDRLAVVTPSGKIIWPDQLLMLFAKDIVSRNPGADVVFDVKSTRHLGASVTSFGGRPIMWKTGHALMKQKMVETGALVGGEYSGHIFIKDRWFGFDDGMYAAARLIEIISLQGESLDMIMSEFPTSPCTPEVRIRVGDSRKFEMMEKLRDVGDFGDGKLTVIDGVRADFPYGWGLIRASNTSPDLTLRFEADDENSLHHIKSLFIRELRKIDNSIQVDWG